MERWKSLTAVRRGGVRFWAGTLILFWVGGWWAFGEPAALSVSSFNIKWLGYSAKRDNDGLAAILKNFDVVAVQELVAPPYPMDFPDGAPVKPDSEAAAFFDAMKRAGFAYTLSEEDTGTGDKIHINSAATEWFVAFYKPGRVQPAPDLPQGFLAEDRSNHPNYERVPYAFALRTPDKHLDFVLISVHLKPDPDAASKARRKRELAAVAAWIDAHDDVEKDFIILGDMNVENGAELAAATPAGFVSLNDELRPTNVSPARPKPYAHVMLRPQFTKEVDAQYDLKVINLIAMAKKVWAPGWGAFPGEPLDAKRFVAAYSDHHPVVFRLIIPAKDDD